jgi:hypothetical protein
VHIGFISVQVPWAPTSAPQEPAGFSQKYPSWHPAPPAPPQATAESPPDFAAQPVSPSDSIAVNTANINPFDMVHTSP